MNVQRETLHVELCERTRAKDGDAPKLVNTFKETYEEFIEKKLMLLSSDKFKKPCTPKLCQIQFFHSLCDRCIILRELKSCDPVRIHRVALCAATKYNDVDMVNLLLSDKHCDFDSDCMHRIPRPLFTAIYTGNVKLVEVFINAGASMTLETYKWSGMKQLFGADPVRPPRHERGEISAVQYACFLNQTEILQLMVRYDNRKKQERYVTYLWISCLLQVHSIKENIQNLNTHMFNNSAYTCVVRTAHALLRYKNIRL